jgi:hypothetical protein
MHTTLMGHYRATSKLGPVSHIATRFFELGSKQNSKMEYSYFHFIE